MKNFEECNRRELYERLIEVRTLEKALDDIPVWFENRTEFKYFNSIWCEYLPDHLCWREVDRKKYEEYYNEVSDFDCWWEDDYLFIAEPNYNIFKVYCDYIQAALADLKNQIYFYFDDAGEEETNLIFI